MSLDAIFVSLVVVWIAIGIVLAVLMGRRGHNAFGWGFLGATLGPIALVLAIQTAFHEQPQVASVVTGGTSREGPVDVIAGIDGSPEAANAVDAAIAILGPRIGRLTLAGVREYGGLAENEGLVRRALDDQVRRLTTEHAPGHPGAVMLTGRPSDELGRHAAEGGYQLLVIGARGAGLAKSMIGSVATRLAAGSPVPTLIVSSEPAPST